MNSKERLAMLRGAAFMREKIAQCLESNPRKAIYECGLHVRRNVNLPKEKDIEYASFKWLDADILKECGVDERE